MQMDKVIDYHLFKAHVQSYLYYLCSFGVVSVSSSYYSCLFLQNNKTIHKLTVYKRAFKQYILLHKQTYDNIQ